MARTKFIWSERFLKVNELFFLQYKALGGIFVLIFSHSNLLNTKIEA